MKKIPALFVRDWEGDKRYTSTVHPRAAWCFSGEGVATIKRDGTCMALRYLGTEGAHEWLSRRMVRDGKPQPAGFIPEETDPETGKTFGWEPAAQSSFAKLLATGVEMVDHPQAVREYAGIRLPGWSTWELCGPKVNGNPERLNMHRLFRHGSEIIPDLSGVALSYDLVRDYLADTNIEGIVWHHLLTGSMVKATRAGFGLAWPVPA